MTSLLIFRSRGSLYGIDANTVLEVVDAPALSPWPGAPVGVVGVVDYRGQVFPVLDVATRIGACSAASVQQPQETDHMIFVGHGDHRTGLLVEEALEMAVGQELRILPDPLPLPMRHLAPYLRGLAGQGERVVLVLDLVALTRFLQAAATPTDLTLPENRSSLLTARAKALAQLPTEPDLEPQRSLVVVSLGGERFGIPAGEVAELTHCPPVTRVPGAPSHLLGLAYHRGGLLRLVDIRHLCGLGGAKLQPHHVVVLSGPGTPTGIVVETIEAVANVAGSGTKLAFEDGWVTVLNLQAMALGEPQVKLGDSYD